jgi:two-component system response regulator YesN
MMRVFIADDEEIIRDGIRNCIEKEQGRFLFAGEAPDGEMALPMLMEMKPDVLITDIRMPFMDGLELAKVVRRTMPWLRIVFLSGHDEFEYAYQMKEISFEIYKARERAIEKLEDELELAEEALENKYGIDD